MGCGALPAEQALGFFIPAKAGVPEFCVATTDRRPRESGDPCLRALPSMDSRFRALVSGMSLSLPPLAPTRQGVQRFLRAGRFNYVIPAKAGIQSSGCGSFVPWIPAFAHYCPEQIRVFCSAVRLGNAFPASSHTEIQFVVPAQAGAHASEFCRRWIVRHIRVPHPNYGRANVG